MSPGHRNVTQRRGRLVAAAAVSALTLIGAPEPASAQGFFDFLFGNPGRRSQQPQQYTPPRAHAYVDPNYPQYDPRERDRVNDRTSQSGPAVAYCVRTCDGRFFPLQRTSGANPTQICSAMCPAAATKVYSGSSIEYATGS